MLEYVSSCGPGILGAASMDLVPVICGTRFLEKVSTFGVRNSSCGHLLDYLKSTMMINLANLSLLALRSGARRQ